MDTFDIHLMDKNDGKRSENWLIAIALILIVLSVALVLAIRYIFKRESAVVLPVTVASFSGSPPSNDSTDTGNGFGSSYAPF